MPAQTNKERFAKALGDKYLPRPTNWKFFIKNVKSKTRRVRSPIPHKSHWGVLSAKGYLDNYKWDYKGRESFVGVYTNPDLTAAEYDAMFIGADIDTRRFVNETQLMTTKWFDYRFMHFVEATYLFTRYYIDAYRRMYRKIISHEGYEMGFTGGFDFLNGKVAKTHRTGFFLARQRADEMGIPYWFYCDYAMKWSVEDRIWNRPPKPNQLYSTELLADMFLAWEDRCRWTLQIPNDERFLLETNIDGDVQQEYQKWLCGQIMSRPHPERGLNTFMNVKPIITEANARKYIPANYVDQVIN